MSEDLDFRNNGLLPPLKVNMTSMIYQFLITTSTSHLKHRRKRKPWVSEYSISNNILHTTFRKRKRDENGLVEIENEVRHNPRGLM